MAWPTAADLAVRVRAADPDDQTLSDVLDEAIDEAERYLNRADDDPAYDPSTAAAGHVLRYAAALYLERVGRGDQLDPEGPPAVLTLRRGLDLERKVPFA